MRTVKKKIFCPVPLPPPYHGSNIITQQILTSEQINKVFDIEIMALGYNENLKNIGRFEFKKLYLFIKYFIRIFKKSRIRYDLVYFVPAVTGKAFIRDLLLLLPLKLKKQNILIHLHGKGIGDAAQNNKTYKVLYKLFFKNTSVICLSERLISDINGVFNGTVYVVNNGIFQESYPIHRKSNHPPVILFLSNLIEAKGVFILLEALNIIKNKGVDFKLNLIGAELGDIIQKIQKTIALYNLQGHIIEIGPKYGEDKRKILQESDMLVFPTQNEAWGLVILESMQAGLPVVSTNEGAIPEIIDDGVTGFIVNKQDVVALANKIIILLTDEKLRHTMGSKGKDKFENNYTFDKVETNMMSVFQKATEIK